MTNKGIKGFSKARRALKFVEHIENHLKNDAPFKYYTPSERQVMCKICDKTIDEILGIAK